MRYTRPDPFDMIESLSLEEKKSLLAICLTPLGKWTDEISGLRTVY